MASGYLLPGIPSEINRRSPVKSCISLVARNETHSRLHLDEYKYNRIFTINHVITEIPKYPDGYHVFEVDFTEELYKGYIVSIWLESNSLAIIIESEINIKDTRIGIPLEDVRYSKKGFQKMAAIGCMIQDIPLEVTLKIIVQWMSCFNYNKYLPFLECIPENVGPRTYRIDV